LVKYFPALFNSNETIGDISKQFKYGKSCRELLLEAVEGERIRTPGHFSDTRFDTYSAEVIKKWFNNYPNYYRHLNRLASGDLDRINNAPFLLIAAELCDIYGEMAIISKQFQNPETTPWQLQQNYEVGMYELQQKLASLDDTKLELSQLKTNMPKLYEVYHNISTSGEYRNCCVGAKASSGVNFNQRSLTNRRLTVLRVFKFNESRMQKSSYIHHSLHGKYATQNSKRV
jgi:hypothetical protein